MCDTHETTVAVALGSAAQHECLWFVACTIHDEHIRRASIQRHAGCFDQSFVNRLAAGSDCKIISESRNIQCPCRLPELQTGDDRTSITQHQIDCWPTADRMDCSDPCFTR